MNKYSVKLSRKSQKQLEQIERYIIDELSNFNAAQKTIMKIVDTMKLLEDMPYIGTCVNDLIGINSDDKFYRLVIENYSIIYEVNEKEGIVEIDLIFNHLRNYTHI